MGTAQEVLKVQIESLQRRISYNDAQLKTLTAEVLIVKQGSMKLQNEIDELQKAIKVLDSNKTTRKR